MWAAHADGGCANASTPADPGCSQQELKGRRLPVTDEVMAFVLLAIRSNDSGLDQRDIASLSAAATTDGGVTSPWMSRQRDLASASAIIGSVRGTQHTSNTTELMMHHSKILRAKDCSTRRLLPRRMTSRATDESVNMTILVGTGLGMLRSR